MSTVTELRELTEQEQRAVELFRKDEPMELIKVETGLTRSQIAAAVGQSRLLDERRAAAPPPRSLAATKAPAPRPAPRAVDAEPSEERRRDTAPAAPVAPTQDVAGWTIEQLLGWADEDGGTRPRSLAARLRLIENELRDLAGRGTAVRDAQAEVDALMAKLAAAKEALRVAKGSKPAASASTRPKGGAQAIRAWAAENHVDCPAFGVIPARVREAYQVATGTDSAT